MKSATPLGRIENYMSVAAILAKMFVVVLTLMLQGKSCSLEEIRGGILALKSVACQKTECQRGLEQTFCDYEHIAKKRGVH